MGRSRHTEAQIIAALKQVEAGRTVDDVARECGVGQATIYTWKSKFGGMEVSEAQFAFTGGRELSPEAAGVCRSQSKHGARSPELYGVLAERSVAELTVLRNCETTTVHCVK